MYLGQENVTIPFPCKAPHNIVYNKFIKCHFIRALKFLYISALFISMAVNNTFSLRKKTKNS